MFIINNFETLIAPFLETIMFYFNLIDTLNNYGNLADYNILTLVIALGLFAGIIKIGKLYKTNVYLLTVLAIISILFIKQIINYENFDNSLPMGHQNLNLLGIFEILHEANKNIVLNSFFEDDLTVLLVSYLILSTIVVGIFALIVFVGWSFKKNIRILTTTIIIGVFFIIVINYFFDDILLLILSDLWMLFFGLIKKSSIIMMKFLRRIYLHLYWLSLNDVIPRTEITILNDLFLFLLVLPTFIVFMMLFYIILTFLVILILGLLLIRVSYWSLLFVTIFSCIYIFFM